MKRRFLILWCVLAMPLALIGCGAGGGGNVPAAPVAPALTPGSGQLIATWNAVAGATRYEVYCGTDKDNPPQSPFAGDGDNTDTRCVITGLTNEIVYYVWVKAGNSNGTNNFGPSAHEAPRAQTPPVPPAGIVAATVSSTEINVSWTDGSGNESGFKIERGLSGTAFSQVGTVAANATSFPDSGLTSNTLYYYRVRAYNEAGDSAYSQTVQAATYAVLGDIQDMVESMMNSLVGNEMSETTVGGSGYNVRILGLSLCLPADPFAPPAAQATPPNNIYGCQNDASVVMSAAGEVVTIIYTIPEFFVDVEIDALMVPGVDAYFLGTDVVSTVQATISTTPDGRIQIGTVMSIDTTIGDIMFDSDNSAVDAAGGMLIGLCESSMISAWNDSLIALTTQLIPSLPPYEP